MPPPIDLTWYGAHELDSYPRALAPLEFDRRSLAEPEHARARMLLWLRIDEQGRIVEITAGEADIPPELLEAARVTLAGVTFAPARKDERAVKSRLLLSVTLGDAFNRER